MSARAARALLFSLAAHAAFLFLVFGLPRPGKETESVVEAPLGSIFVSEDRNQNRNQNQDQIQDQQQVSPEPQPAPPPAAASTGSAPGVPDGEARPVGTISPVYPPLSRKLGEEGEAAFWIEIRADGTVAAVRLDRSSGHDRLDEAAAAALRAARFEPAIRNGEATASRRCYRIEFRLSASHGAG